MNQNKLELNDGMLADLFHQLALLMHSGIRLDDALMLLSDEEEDKAFSEMLQNTAACLEVGTPFYQALEETELFPSHVTGLLQMSEYAGRTQEALEALSRIPEKKARLESMRGALLGDQLPDKISPTIPFYHLTEWI